MIFCPYFQAKNIKNKPIINRDVESTRIAAMQTEIQALREELQRHRLGTANSDTVSEWCTIFFP